jgi:hypothetical protein
MEHTPSQSHKLAWSNSTYLPQPNSNLTGRKWISKWIHWQYRSLSSVQVRKSNLMPEGTCILKCGASSACPTMQACKRGTKKKSASSPLVVRCSLASRLSYNATYASSSTTSEFSNKRSWASRCTKRCVQTKDSHHLFSFQSILHTMDNQGTFTINVKYYRQPRKMGIYPVHVPPHRTDSRSTV